MFPDCATLIFISFVFIYRARILSGGSNVKKSMCFKVEQIIPLPTDFDEVLILVWYNKAIQEIRIRLNQETT